MLLCTLQKTVAAALLMLYVIMQTFAIPGTISLSLLCGALYGSTRGFFLIALISTLGSTACYCMSWCFGRPIAHAIWKGKLDEFSAQIAKRKNDLLNYIIFLRVTPILPNTFINVASPIVGVPLYHFIVGKTCALCSAPVYECCNAKQGRSKPHPMCSVLSWPA